MPERVRKGKVERIKESDNCYSCRLSKLYTERSVCPRCGSSL